MTGKTRETPTKSGLGQTDRFESDEIGDPSKGEPESGEISLPQRNLNSIGARRIPSADALEAESWVINSTGDALKTCKETSLLRSSYGVWDSAPQSWSISTSERSEA